MLWHCWLSNRKGIRPVKTGYWFLVMTIWLGLCTYYSFGYHLHLHHPYLQYNPKWRHSGTSLPRSTWKMAVKMERQRETETERVLATFVGHYGLCCRQWHHKINCPPSLPNSHEVVVPIDFSPSPPHPNNFTAIPIQTKIFLSLSSSPSLQSTLLSYSSGNMMPCVSAYNSVWPDSWQDWSFNWAGIIFWLLWS